MALQAVYKQFLAAPNSSALAQNASLHYITTTTSFHGPTEVIKHLNAQRNHMKKNREDFLNVIEGQNALAVQTELALEFLDDGGPYLPGLDDQFLSDRMVEIAVMHIVKFDSDSKITNIQQSWDQGALLKQLDVIGKTGRNWPIRDSKEQTKMIARTAVKSGAPSTSEVASRSPPSSTHASREYANAPKAGVALDAVKSKHQQTWDFEGFQTPEKPKYGKPLRKQEMRHWGTDENDIDESPAKAAPGKAGAPGKARRDADSHFEMLDDGSTSVPRGPARPCGAGYTGGMSLYNNHMVTEDGSDPHQSPDPRALGNITNQRYRSKNEGAHFTMADESPKYDERTRAPVPDDRKKNINNMQASWSTYDRSPSVHKENKPSRDAPKDLRENGPNHHIKLGGDGMGNPKGGRGWSIGDDSEEEAPAAVPGRKGAGQQAASSFWDY